MPHRRVEGRGRRRRFRPERSAREARSGAQEREGASIDAIRLRDRQKGGDGRVGADRGWELQAPPVGVIVELPRYVVGCEWSGWIRRAERAQCPDSSLESFPVSRSTRKLSRALFLSPGTRLSSLAPVKGHLVLVHRGCALDCRAVEDQPPRRTVGPSQTYALSVPLSASPVRSACPTRTFLPDSDAPSTASGVRSSPG